MATTITLTYGPTTTLPDPIGNEQKDLMDRAFALVSPEVWGRGDWKETVSAVLSNADLAAANVTLDDVVASVEFMTATKATVTNTTNTKSECAYIVRADGYRRGPAN